MSVLQSATIRVEANGISFEVLTAGSGDRLALCLHGFPEHAYSWRYQMPVLVDLGYRVWAPNLRGYGATDSPQNLTAYRLEVLLNDVAALMQAADAEETVLIGHDWGGLLAWLIATDRPQLIERLIVLNLPHPACFLREVKRPIQFLKSWYALLFQVPYIPEFLLGSFRAWGIGQMIRRSACDRSRFPPEVLEVYRRNALRPGGLTAMLNWYRAALQLGGLEAFSRVTYPVIDIPILFLWGDADAALSLLTTNGTEKYATNLTFRVLHGVSHWIQQEAAQSVNAMMSAWLKGDPVPQYEELERSLGS